jgi:hypothetical protein
MADAGVAGERFHQVYGALVRGSHHGVFHAAVLVAQRDLQVQDLFTVALEPEVARFDYAGVDRANGYFVNF